MDIFCRCEGCKGCSGGDNNPTGGSCDNPPQKYTVKSNVPGKESRWGYRSHCKPCLRRQEQARNATKQVQKLGLVPPDAVTKGYALASRPSTRSFPGRARPRRTRAPRVVPPKPLPTRTNVICAVPDDAPPPVSLPSSGHDDVSGNRPRIVLFGDSITEQSFGDGGFGAALADRYRRHADVMLRGYSGYNSADAVALLPHVFPLDDPTPPVLVTVCFGANDAVKPDSGAARVQGCPLDAYARNVRAIVAHLKKLKPPPRVLVMTPPPVDAEAWQASRVAKGYTTEEESDRELSRTLEYANAAMAAAREGGAGVIGLDLFGKLVAVKGWERCMSDGLHLSPEGYRRATEFIVDAVERKLGLVADANPSDFPDYKTVSLSNPSRTIDAFVAAKRRRS